mmetsp:Transcript_32632/g.86100  ORF Transcript_32632/g.86100 Transcript_32632/m.86100 type:complete len:394 (+) Transcript_32632:773-1954(+)
MRKLVHAMLWTLGGEMRKRFVTSSDSKHLMSLCKLNPAQIRPFPLISGGIHSMRGSTELNVSPNLASINRKTKLDLAPARKIVRSVPAIKAAIHESVATPAEVSGSLAPGVLCDETFIKTFWRDNTDTPEGHHFMLSEPCLGTSAQLNCFVSHCWSPPSDWMVGEEEDAYALLPYEEAKSRELAELCIERMISMGSDEDPHQAWKRTTLWIDKASIPQNQGPEIKMKYVLMIEHFITLSDSLLVLLSHTYFTRLWCIYEWACFLISKDPRNIFIGSKYFMTPESQPKYLAAVRGISVAKAECFAESDRPILEAKVGQYYRDAASFERYVKITAVALLAKDMLEFATDEDDEKRWLLPWVDLARELNFHELVAAIEQAKPVQWHLDFGHGRYAL